MKNRLLKFVCITLSVLNLSAHADNAPINVATQIRATLKQTLPELPVDQVNTLPFNGIYEVISGRKVFYVDASGRYAILGNLVDLNIKQSMTEQKVQSLSFVDWNKLPTKIAITKVIGQGRRKIAVFTDPECPFCKRLDADILVKQKNLTIYYFLYPLAMHAGAEEDAKRILCAENPDQTYIDWMVNDKKLPVQSKCKRAGDLETMKKVGSQLVGVEATPTIILPNGQMISGLVPADYLAKLITDTSPSTVGNESRAVESQVKDNSRLSIQNNFKVSSAPK